MFCSRRTGPLLLALAGVIAGCHGSRDPVPEGTSLEGDGTAVRQVLEELVALEGTPVGRDAKQVFRRIADCPEVVGHCPPGVRCTVMSALRCASDGDPLVSALRNLRGDAAVVTTVREGGWRAVFAGRMGATGGVEVDGTVESPDDPGGVRLVLPAEGEPGRWVLSGEEALVHARIRPADGLELASLVEVKGLAARLYQLRSDLFLATALGDSWEVAAYLPEEGARMPDLVLAVDYTDRRRAETAMEHFIDRLQERWPIERSPLELAASEGTCLGNLNVLPGLAPCYLITDRALVAGWNRHSLERALADPPPEGPSGSRLVAYLDRFPAADRRLRSAWGSHGQGPLLTYPWSRLEIAGGGGEGRYRLRLDLRGGEVR